MVVGIGVVGQRVVVGGKVVGGKVVGGIVVGTGPDVVVGKKVVGKAVVDGACVVVEAASSARVPEDTTDSTMGRVHLPGKAADPTTAPLVPSRATSARRRRSSSARSASLNAVARSLRDEGSPFVSSAMLVPSSGTARHGLSLRQKQRDRKESARPSPLGSPRRFRTGASHFARRFEAGLRYNLAMRIAGIPRRRQDVLVDRLDDELLLYHPTLETAVYLNETAFLVWQLCDGRRSVAEISELLEGAFPGTAESIVSDVDVSLRSLAERGVIEFA